MVTPIATLRPVTVRSGLSSQTKLPSGPWRTAAGGTVTAPRTTSTVSRALTNSLGYSVPAALGIRALPRIVPVAVSTRLSSVEKLPPSSVRVRP